MGLRHLTAATLPDDPSKEVSSGEWNEDHKFTDANIGALLVRGASSDLVAGVSSVAIGQVLVSQGAGSLPVWSSSPSLTGLTLSSDLLFSGGNIGDGAGSSPPFVYAETSFIVADAGSIGTAGRGTLRFDADGIARLTNAAGTAFTRFILGTNDASGVGFRKVGATIELVTGDSSANTSLLGSFLAVTQFFEGAEIADPSAPSANKGRLYFKDNGSGKTQLAVRFPTGAVQILSTEP